MIRGMKIHQGSATVKTASRICVENITPLLRREVAASGIATGLAVVIVPHTTCGVVVNEDESGLRADLARLAERLLVPLQDEGPFRHDAIDNNARAHLTAALLGHESALPVIGSQLSLGEWQSLFLIEMDGPRTRKVQITILGEP